MPVFCFQAPDRPGERSTQETSRSNAQIVSRISETETILGTLAGAAVAAAVEELNDSQQLRQVNRTGTGISVLAWMPKVRRTAEKAKMRMKALEPYTAHPRTPLFGPVYLHPRPGAHSLHAGHLRSIQWRFQKRNRILICVKSRTENKNAGKMMSYR